jgi:replicative DNA helicase
VKFEVKCDRVADLEAEKAAVGAVLLQPDAFDRAELEPSDFFDPKHRAIWEAMGRLRAKGDPIDPVTLEIALGNRSRAVGGLTYLSELAGFVPTADNVEWYARQIREDALTREIYQRTSALLSSGRRGEDLLAGILEVVTQAGRRQADDSVLMSDLARARFKKLCDLLDAKARGEDIVLGVMTGIPQLDFALGGGLQFRVATILGGRPSHGKSALARTLAGNAARAGFPTHVFSPEDERDSYVDREFSDKAGINLHALKSLDLDAKDVRRLVDATDELHRLTNWRIDDAAGLSASQIAARVRRWKKELGTKLVVVDYIQLLKEPSKEKRTDEVGASMRGLVELARTEDVAVLVLSQLTRLSDRENRPPKLSDLRESGDLEQAAKAVIFVWQWETKDREKRAEVLVAKNKDGPRDFKVDVVWHPETATYRPKDWRDR